MGARTAYILQSPEFAIQVAAKTPAWLRDRLLVYGALTLVVGDDVLSADDGDVDLVACGIDARELLGQSGRRTRVDLDPLSAPAAYHELVGKHLECVPEYNVEWNRSAHILDEAFDSAVRDLCRIALYRRADGSDRVIVKTWQTGALKEYTVATGVCDEAIRGFLEWVTALAAELGEPRATFRSLKWEELRNRRK